MKSQFIFIGLIVLSLNGWGQSPIQTDLSSGTIELQNSIQDDFLSYSAERESLKNLSLFNALSSSADKFLTLKAAYDKGTPVSFQQIYGVYAGVCYQKYAYSNTKEDDYYRYNPMSGALVVKEFEPEIDNGPLFPEKEKKVLQFDYTQKDYFSQHTAEQIVKELLAFENSWKKNYRFRSEILTLSPLKIKTSTNAVNPNNESYIRLSDIHSFVLYQNYIVTKVFAGETRTVQWRQQNSNQQVTIQKDEDFKYCYFFDKK